MGRGPSMVPAVTLLLLADRDPTPPLVGLVLLASLVGLALVVWRGSRGAAAAQRGQAEVAERLARGDVDGALAAGGDRPAEERARALAGGAWLRLQRATAAAKAAAYEADEDEPRPLDQALVVGPAVKAVHHALQLAPRDGKTLALAAVALSHASLWDACRAVLVDAARIEELDGPELVDLAHVAGDADAPAAAHVLAERALLHRSTDLQLFVTHGRALLALDRPADAIPTLERGLAVAKLQVEGIDAGLSQSVHQLLDLQGELEDLHDDAVRRTSSAEKTIDAHVLGGRLDPRAGVNYKLMAHSLLVESTRRARRLLLPAQDVLLRDAEAALATDADSIAGLEDAALHALRDGAFERAEELFRRAADLAPGGWPVLAGLGATLELRKARSWKGLPPAPSLPALARIVEPWAALTDVERTLVALALAPVAHLVPALADAGARLQVAALDAKLTDLPAFRAGAGTVVEHEDDRRTHDAIDGMAIDLTAAIKIEAFHERDDERWVLAHELGHVLQCFLEARAGDQAEAFAAELDALFAEAERVSWRSTEYGLRNVFEFFATGYERFALRRAFPDAPRSETHGADIDLGVDAFLRKWTAP